MAVASDTGTARTTDTAQDTGLFIVSYEVSTGVLGAPTLNLQLSVYTPEKTVTGYGSLSQALPEPPAFATRLDGTYTYLTVMPDTSHILVTLTGYPLGIVPPIGLVLLPNCDVRMVLDDTWESGVATFWYADETGKHEIEDARVRRVPAEAAEAIDLQHVVLPPQHVSARYVGDLLVIHASGEEDGVTGIHIEESPMDIYPPRFSVVGRRTPAIGMFPYATTGTFGVQGLTEVTFTGPSGERRYPVSNG